MLGKREVQYVLFTGIALDELAERKLLPEPCRQSWKRMNPVRRGRDARARHYECIRNDRLTSFGYLER